MPRPRPDRPVRVALAITDLDVGGAERALVALANGLDRRRWEPAVYCLGPRGELARPLVDAGIPVTCLDVNKRRPIDAIRRLSRCFRQGKPSLVQGFLFHANIASRLAAWLAGVPVALGGLRVAERRAQWHLAVDALTFGLSAGSVCVSEGVRRYSRDVGRLPPSRLYTIPNGVDPGPIDAAKAVDRASLGLRDGDRIALFVGRIDAQKSVSALLKAARLAFRDRPDWHLAIVGDGPDRLVLEHPERLRGEPPTRATLQDRPSPAAIGPEDRIHWLGRRPDVFGLLKIADMFVLPSLWEGMPNAVLEAMAAGLPVVGTRVEGTEELVVEGETGWLVAPGDVDALADVLAKAADDPRTRERMGRAGRARVEVHYTQTQVINSYDRLWSTLLGLPEESLDPAARPADGKDSGRG